MAYIGNDVDAIFIPSSVNTSTDLRINGGALTQTGGDVNLDGGTFFLDESANRVGIGTITPGVTLDVVGTIRATNINALDLSVEDKNIVIGDVASPTNTTADGGGVTLKGAVDKTIAWLNATAAWTFSEHISIAGAKEYRIAGTKVLDATSLGSAVVSSSLTSVGTIASGTWQGAVIADTYLGTISTALKVSNSATTAASANTASAIVARDASGNFTAGTITAALTGAASSNVLKAGDTMTGALVVPLGVFGTPSITFTGDLDTGIYSPGADQLAVATDGTGRLFVNSTGDLGVNTGGTQGTKLHVIGGNVWNSNFYEVARFQKLSGTAVSLGFDNTAYVATIGAYSHDGTASNLSFWTYPGSGNVQERLRITSTGTVNILGAGTAGSTQAVSFSGTAPVNSLVLDSSGRVGLGISSPSALLHCFSPDSINTTAYFRLTNSSVGSGLYRNLHIDGTHPNGASFWKGIDITPVQALLAPMTGIDMSWNQIYGEGRGVNINFSKNTHHGGGAGIGVFSRVIATGTDSLSHEAIGGWFVTDKGAGALDPYTSYTLKVENRSTVNNTNLTAFYTDSSTIRGSIYYDRTNNALALSGSNAFRIDTNGSSRLFVNSSGNVGIGTTSPGQTLHVVGSTELSKLNLSGISSSISSTAVDVFVYDTRKDSDGGAWRKRTQHTSWYNETLNTATRGSRKDFPAVAVIVASTGTTGITIYDGDDPDMPMWIKYNYLSWDGPINGISAVNGIIAGVIFSGASYSGNGLVLLDFIKDRQSRNFLGGYANFKNGFVHELLSTTRNDTTYLTIGTNTREYNLINYEVNDVAMTVLPNAPIDPSTGLPVPTIAVATNGGTSIIRDDGTVTNAGGSTTTKISINEKGIVYFASTANGGYYGYSLVGGSLDPFFNTVGNLRILSNVNSNTNNNLVVPNAFNLYSGQTIGLTIVNKDFLNTYNDYNGMVAYATTSYNTGWMHGNCKGAWLSDTSTASVTGTELVTNGNFSTSDLSAWTTIDGGTAVITGGLLKLTDTSNAFVYASAPFTTVVGKQYVVTFDIVNNGNNTANYNYVRIGNSHNSTALHDTNYGTAYGKYQVTITATATTTYITLINGLSNGLFGYWDNVSARLAEPDRSVNNKGLAVYGTITKTAVATGANLVGYSGFSESNYLKQPHNSSLEFGTGSFSCTVWFKSSTADGIYYKGLVYLNRNGSIGEGFQILLNPSNDIYFYIYGPTNDFSGTSHTGYNDGNWHQISVSSTGTHQRVYLDGVLKETGNITTGSITDTSSELFIGNYGVPGYQFYWRGSIALCRISASIPSPSQILKIYNDEKMLFQENSQATLYGASDAVTALAYDDTTDLLSVGTSSGRSDFSGLKRINNTTTAVTTAISASNGLIAEQ